MQFLSESFHLGLSSPKILWLMHFMSARCLSDYPITFFLFLLLIEEEKKAKEEGKARGKGKGRGKPKGKGEAKGRGKKKVKGGKNERKWK